MEDQIIVQRLTALEVRELQDAVGDKMRRLPDEATAQGQHGEPGLIAAAVVVSALAVKALAVILTRREARLRIRVERRTAEGTTIIELDQSASEVGAQDAEVLDALGRAFSVDLSTSPDME